jgi:hypothetical protein
VTAPSSPSLGRFDGSRAAPRLRPRRRRWSQRCLGILGCASRSSPFPRAAGATTVWVRWCGGRVDAPSGIPVIDLVEATAG